MNERDEALLDRYLDGQLPAKEKAAFEQRIAKDAELRKQVELQKKIDSAVIRTLPPPPSAKEVLERARGEQKKIVKPAFGRRRIVALVSLAAVLLVAVLAYLFVFGEKPVEPGKVAKLPHRTFEQAYAERLAKGFKPDWVCNDEAEFMASYKKAIGQPLKVAKTDPGVVMDGLAYFNTMSPWTIGFLAHVDGKEVLVFGDPLSYDENPKLTEGSKLHLHKRVIDKVVLYELSPFDKPRVLPLFERG